jgi:hypothetical protein
MTHPVGFGEFPETLGCVQGIGFFLIKIGHYVGTILYLRFVSDF